MNDCGRKRQASSLASACVVVNDMRCGCRIQRRGQRVAKRPRLNTLKPRIEVAAAGRVSVNTTSERRVTGRALQSRRLRIWSHDPRCVDCGRMTDYPHGFELDHEVPLEHGGSDDDGNMKIRCVWFDLEGAKRGCHEEKTRREAKVRGGMENVF